MVKKQDDLSKLKGNKKSVRFNELERILNQHGWILQSTSGSHHIYCRKGCLPIMIVRPHGKHKFCHPMDVNKVIAGLESEKEVDDKGDDYENES